MRIIPSLILGALLLPALASAESFDAARTIELSQTISAPRSVLLTLDAQTRVLPESSLRIVNSDGTATAFARLNDVHNHMPEALFDAIPVAAGTVPQTDVSMMLDSSVSTAFQPVIGETQKFRFHFTDPIAPTLLEYTMDSGDISGVKVRAGDSFQNLRDVYVGVPLGSHITLAGENARAFEVVFTVRQGVARFAEMKLYENRSRLLFRAVPSQRYALLSGGSQTVPNPQDTTLTERDAIVATLGARRALSAAEKGDNDGIVDEHDNCPDIWNPEQHDRDADGAGDMCDTCPQHVNPDQADSDKNGRGDVCEDSDRDGVVNIDDNCPEVRNPAQQDEDKDGIGNTCDNIDSRFTATRPWLLWAGMAMIIIVLAGIGTVIMGRTRA